MLDLIGKKKLENQDH